MFPRRLALLPKKVEFWLVALILVTHLAIALFPVNSLLSGWFPSDDAFYYFKVAQNIDSGLGITFDGLSRTNGFHPLWMLICLPLFLFARIDLILPLRLIVLVAGGLTALSSVLLFRLLRRWLPTLLALAAAVFWAFYPFLHQNITRQGMETALSTCCSILTLYLLSRMESQREDHGFPLRQVALVGFSAALMVLSRLDNIFLAGMIGLWLLLRSPAWQHAPRALRLYLPIDLALTFLAVPFGILFRTVGIVPGFLLAIPIFIVLEALIRIPLHSWLGLYRAAQPSSQKTLLLRTSIAALAGSLVFSAVIFIISTLFPAIQFPRSLPLVEVTIVFTGMLATRVLLSKKGLELPNEKMDWSAWLKTAASFALPPLILIGGYMTFNHLYFGTLTPISGQIKQWWSTLPVTIYSHPTEPALPFLRMFPVLISSAWSLIGGLWPGGALILTAIAILVWQRSWSLPSLIQTGLFPLLGGIWLQVVYYQVIGYLHTRLWYWSNVSLWIVLLLALACGALTQRFNSQFFGRVIRILSALLIFVIMGLWTINVIKTLPPIDHKTEITFQRSALWLEQNTQPGSLIGMTGGGVDAYFIKERTIVNLDGLMNSVEYFKMMRDNTANQYLDRIGLDYVFGKPYSLLETDPYRTIFSGRVVAEGYGEGMTLYRYNDEKK